MELPKALILTDCAYALDGGSLSLSARDGSGASHEIRVPQWKLPSNDIRGRGRLHFDGTRIELRSDDEKKLLELVEQAALDPELIAEEPGSLGGSEAGNRVIVGDDIQAYSDAIEDSPATAVKYMARQIVQHVRSEVYLQLAGEADRDGNP